MASPRIERAHKLAADIRAVLAAAGETRVHVTLNTLEVESASRGGVVLIAPPDLAFGGPWGDVQAEYEVYVIAGPADNLLAAWERIDTIIQALVEGDINLRHGKPGGFHGAPTSPELSAYILTLNDLD